MKSYIWSINSYSKESDEDIFLKLIFNTYKVYKTFQLIYQKKIKIEKVEKLIANLNNKTKYVILIKNLTHALNDSFEKIR